MEIKSSRPLICPDCGGEFSTSDLLDGDSVVTCINCSKKYNVSEILHKTVDERVEEIKQSAYKDVETEKIKSFENIEKDKTQAYREVEEGKRQIERERMQFEIAREEKEEKTKQVGVFKKSKLKIVIIILMIISVMFCAVAFKDGKLVAGIIAAVMTILFICCFLMGLGYIPEKIKGQQIITFIIACILFLPCTFTYTSLKPNDLQGDIGLPDVVEMSEISWPQSSIAQIVPDLNLVMVKSSGKLITALLFILVILLKMTTRNMLIYVGIVGLILIIVEARNTFGRLTQTDINYKSVIEKEI